MNRTFKYMLSRVYKPVVEAYLSKTRVFRYGTLRLRIPKEVFHPGFFHSTRLLLKYLNSMPVEGKEFLELGAGSGLISFIAAQRGAIVTATDINAIAVANLVDNSKANALPIVVLESDMFKEIPIQRFDIIAINPPYYKKDPASEAEHAWYCGAEGQYFKKLFAQIGAFSDERSFILMVLSDECDLPMVRRIAADNDYQLVTVLEKNVRSEQLYIFRVVTT